jgi:hypothetical protein
MAYKLRQTPVHTKETRAAERIAKIIMEDFALDLEAVGFHLVRNHPIIVSRRLEVLALSAGEEHDTMVAEFEKGRY